MKRAFFILIVLIIVLVSLLKISPVLASSCWQFNQQKICFLEIKRSAKFHWRYRVKITADGVRKPLAVYDCRQKLKIVKNSAKIPFSQDGVGEYICETLGSRY